MSPAKVANLVPALAALLATAVAPAADPSPAPVQGQSGAAAPAKSGSVPVVDDRPRPGLLLREGALLIERQGWIHPVGSLRWVMVFDKTKDGPRDPSMVLLPCVKLSEMRRIVEARPETVTFKVTGRVLTYRDRNYLLPTFFTIVPDAGAPEAQSHPEPTPAQAEEARRSLDDVMGRGNDAPVDPNELIKKMDKATPRESSGSPPAANRPSAASTAPSSAGLMHEGQVMVSRRGRLVRAASGELVFAPDSGSSAAAGSGGAASGPVTAAATGPASADPKASPVAASVPAGPMRLLPCLNLQEMERLTRNRAVPTQFKVSGEVFVYEGRNYLLPTMYLVEQDREGNVTPAQ